MNTKVNSQSTVVGVFHDRQQAQRAVAELRRRGFSEQHIGVAHRDSDEGGSVANRLDDAEDETYASEGAAAGLATGAGIGALWGLGIMAGVLPAIGPAIAGGTLAAILSSAAAGAAAAGLGGALVGLGLSKEEADYYNTEFEAGRTVVTVSAAGRVEEAESVLREFGSYNISHKGQATSSMDSSAMGSHPSASTADTSGSSLTGSSAAHMSGSTCETSGTSLTGSTSHCSTAASNKSGENRVTAYEEQLNVEKRPVETGSVNVRKEVHTEHKTIEVPVTREEIVVERHAASGTDADSGAIGGHQEIRIPVREEQVHVEKQTVAKEDVVIGKRTVHETQRIDETLRKEEIKVESDPNVRIRDQRGQS